MLEQPKVEVAVNSIYKVGKLKQEVAYTDFSSEVWKFYMAVKCNPPELIVLKYSELAGTDEAGNPVYRPFAKTLKEIGDQDLCKTVRAVAATGACIMFRKHDVDGGTIRHIYCFGMHQPSLVLANRGDIFSSSSELQINCKTLPELIGELLK